MIEWGQKSKPQKIPRASNKTKKIPGPNFNPQKILRRISEPKKFQEELHGRGTRKVSRIFRLFSIPKKSRLKSSYPQKSCQNFPTKKIPKSKISNPQNTSIIPVICNTEYPPPPWSCYVRREDICNWSPSFDQSQTLRPPKMYSIESLFYFILDVSKEACVVSVERTGEERQKGEWYLCQILRTNNAIICLYYYPQKVCNFHKYHCSKPIKLQKFFM